MDARARKKVKRKKKGEMAWMYATGVILEDLVRLALKLTKNSGVRDSNLL